MGKLQKVMKGFERVVINDDITIRYIDEMISCDKFLEKKAIYISSTNADYYDAFAEMIRVMGGKILEEALFENIGDVNEVCMIAIDTVKAIVELNSNTLQTMQDSLKRLYFLNQKFANECISHKLPGKIANILLVRLEDECFIIEPWEHMIGGIAKSLGNHKIRVNGLLLESWDVELLKGNMTFLFSEHANHITGVCLKANGR